MSPLSSEIGPRLSSGSSPKKQLPRLLIAEGDVVTGTHIRELMAKSGYDVVLAKDGQDALHYLQSDRPPGLAIVGWTCAKRSGAEICRQIREQKNRRYIHVILLTTWNQQKEVAEALEAGADDCMYKPVDGRELLLRLQTGSRIILERALRDSEARFQLAFEQAAIGMALLDTKGRFVQVNQALCRLFGYTEEEFLGMNLESVSHPENLPPTRILIPQLVKGEFTGEDLERRYLCKDASMVWAAVTASLAHHEDGAPVLIVQFKDISKRKAAEDALRRSEAFARAITDNVEDLVMVMDLERKWQYASPSHVSGIGYAPRELIGQDVLAIVHPEDRRGFEASIQELLLHQNQPLAVVRLLHKNGSPRHFEARGSLVRGLIGRTDGIVVVLRAIDERIRSDQELQAAHAETELFLQSIPSILIGLDVDGRITRWNRSAAEIFHLSGEQVLGHTIEHCGIHWLQPEISQEVVRWLATKTAYRGEDLAYESEGKRRFLGFSVHRVKSDGDEPPRFIVSGADISERKNLEFQLRQAQKLEAIGQLAAGIAHEINTPTQYVGDNTTFLKDSWQSIADLLDLSLAIRRAAGDGGIPQELLDRFDRQVEQSDLEYLLTEIPRALEQSLDGVQRVAKIVKGMKEFSHPGSEEKRALDINRAIENTITVARHEWKYVADVVTEFGADLPLVPCLIGEFNQVILNLIINAAHAIDAAIAKGLRDKGRIVIRTRRDGPWAEVAVKDNGIGMAADVQSRVFEPFFTTKPLGKGTGQGLTLSHAAIVKRQKGQLWFETEPGQGTTFFIRLPLETDPVTS
jgi:PAS domain S-box-containing protein